jgi:hypothetical protein
LPVLAVWQILRLRCASLRMTNFVWFGESNSKGKRNSKGKGNDERRGRGGKTPRTQR